jgi:hypothetical protein
MGVEATHGGLTRRISSASGLPVRLAVWLAAAPSMAHDTSNRNEERARTSEQHKGKHTQFEPAHHLTSPAHGGGSTPWPGPAFTDKGSVSSTSRQKLPSGEGGDLLRCIMTGVSASVLFQASLKITVAGFTLHLTRPCPPHPKGSRAAWGSSVSVTGSQPRGSIVPHPQHGHWNIIICWIKRGRPQDSVEIDDDHFTELGMGTGTGGTGMASSP